MLSVSGSSALSLLTLQGFAFGCLLVAGAKEAKASLRMAIPA